MKDMDRFSNYEHRFASQLFVVKWLDQQICATFGGGV
jgi:hypothetical protein